MYKKKLTEQEWDEKRKIILERDNYTCFKCKSSNVQLHVHHKIYMQDKEPWQYANKHLITLCDTCHAWVHGTENINVVKVGQKTPYYLKSKQKIKRRLDVDKMEEMLSKKDKELNERYKNLESAYRTVALPDLYVPKQPKFVGPKKKKNKLKNKNK